MSKDDKLDEVKHPHLAGQGEGFLTYDELNNALPADVLSSEQLDNLMVMFGEMDIEVVDSAEEGASPLAESERRSRRLRKARSWARNFWRRRRKRKSISRPGF
jgi:hypothetical protein